MRSTGQRGSFSHLDSKHEEIKNESGLGRFVGVVAVLLVVIGLGGGFHAQAAQQVDWDVPSGIITIENEAGQKSKVKA